MQIYVKTIAIRSPTCMFVICQRPSTRNMTVSKERYHFVRSPSWYSNYCYTIFVSGETVSSILKENFLFFSFLCDTYSKCRQRNKASWWSTLWRPIKFQIMITNFNHWMHLASFFFAHFIQYFLSLFSMYFYPLIVYIPHFIAFNHFSLLT